MTGGGPHHPTLLRSAGNEFPSMATNGSDMFFQLQVLEPSTRGFLLEAQWSCHVEDPKKTSRLTAIRSILEKQFASLGPAILNVQNWDLFVAFSTWEDLICRLCIVIGSRM